MTEKENSFELVTLKGKGEYFYVNSNVATYQGKTLGYSFNLILDKENENKVRAAAIKVLKAAQENENWKNSSGNTVSKEDWLPVEFLLNKFIKKKKDTGEKFIKCKAAHEKNGKRVYIPIFNKLGRLSENEEENIALYSGSEIAVELVLYVFHTPSVQGVTTKIRSIQVLKAVSATSAAGSSFTFDNVDDEENVPI